MRYWQHGETGRLLAIDLQMAPSNWTEITEEQYLEAERIMGNDKIDSTINVV